MMDESELQELIKKGETTDDIRTGIGLLRKHKIPVSAFFMVGFPTETKEEALETLKFAKSLKVDTLVLSILTPYPGTEIYKYVDKDDIRFNKIEFMDFYHQSPNMGLTSFNLKGTEYREFVENYFSEVDRYNKNPVRLLRRFLIVFCWSPFL